jgi:lipid A 3-O-deacylase
MATPVLAEDLGLELRGGLAISGIELSSTLFAPDVDTFDRNNLDTLQLDALYTLSSGTLDVIGSPRLEVGTLINLRGRESLIHAGLNWHLPVGDSPLFLEVGVGGAVHNGSAEPAPPFRGLGCPFAFHYSYGAGFNLPNNWTVVAEFQHASHAGLCGPNNQGLNNFGVVAGRKF